MRKITAAILFLLVSHCVIAGNFNNITDHLKGYNKKYFIYVNKGLKRLYLVDRKVKVWKSYKVATGAKGGMKLFSGDNKTPSGVYRVKEIYQYREPWYMGQLRDMMKKYDRGSSEYRYYRDYYDRLYSRHKKGQDRIKGLNSAYLSAEEGHVKYGTEEDLGYNAYGPVFMLLNYPTADDRKQYEKFKEQGLVPRDENGEYIPLGGGIAIHGTSDDPSLGYDASAGCVRMKNNDIIELSGYVSEGSLVVID